MRNNEQPHLQCQPKQAPYVDIPANVRGPMEHKSLVALEFYEQDGDLVVPGHGLGLVIQAARDEGAPQIRQRLALHAHLGRQNVVTNLQCITLSETASIAELLELVDAPCKH